MKKNAIAIIDMMHQAVPEASFEIRYWDNDSIRIGTQPQFVLQFKTRNCRRR